jgi:hypothetical protein
MRMKRSFIVEMMLSAAKAGFKTKSLYLFIVYTIKRAMMQNDVLARPGNLKPDILGAASVNSATTTGMRKAKLRFLE